MGVVIDTRIMGCRVREALIADMLSQLRLPESIVTYDDRPTGGDAMYTSRKCWSAPIAPGVTHRLVLQDDLDLCDGFPEIARTAASCFPKAIFCFYNPRVRYEHRKTTSPYVLIPGAGLYGPALMLPARIIQGCFAWIARCFGPGYKHDDCAIGEYASRHGIPVFTTIPSVVQHLMPTKSLLRYNNPRKVSKVWQGRDVSAEDWQDRDYSRGPTIRNNLYLPKDHPWSA